MPRKNHRHEAYEPLDLTRADISPRPPLRKPDGLGPDWADDREHRQRERAELADRQRRARMNRGIDWSACLVPGCTEVLSHRSPKDPDHRDHRTRLPLCITHLSVAYLQSVRDQNEPLLVDAVARTIERERTHEAELHEARKQEHLAQQDGDIYYIRLNGLIKVGWTRDLRKRLKAYGPDVEILAHHPATRQDETNLHRQLRPVLAKGREWYEDCKVLHDFVAQAVELHGQPHARAEWTVPSESPIGRRPAARSKPTGLSIV